MNQFNTTKVVDSLINEYGLQVYDVKRDIFNKTFEYFYDYFRDEENENCVIAIECANTLLSDTNNFKQICKEIEERSNAS